jgi:hypothetical protein
LFMAGNHILNGPAATTITAGDEFITKGFADLTYA